MSWWFLNNERNAGFSWFLPRLNCPQIFKSYISISRSVYCNIYSFHSEDRSWNASSNRIWRQSRKNNLKRKCFKRTFYIYFIFLKMIIEKFLKFALGKWKTCNKHNFSLDISILFFILSNTFPWHHCISRQSQQKLLLSCGSTPPAWVNCHSGCSKSRSNQTLL